MVNAPLTTDCRQSECLSDERPLRVAYIVNTFHTGGIERCVAHLCNHLDREQFRPMVICLDQSGSAAGWITRDGVDVVEIRKKPRNDIGAIRRLAEVLRRHHVDIVHSHNWGTLVETSIARRRAGVPVHVHTEHGQGLHAGLRGAKRLLRGLAVRWCFQRANAVVICAESIRSLIHAHSGFPESRLQFIPNGIEPPTFASAGLPPMQMRKELGISESACVVGSLSRLVAVKDFGTVIDAVGLLSENPNSVHFVLVGDGPEEKALRDRAQAAGVSDRVHFVGRQSPVGDWLAMFDIYVNSSRSEAMSMGILEAMAVGLPVIATDVGDNASLVGGEELCGEVVPSGDPSRMADAIKRLANEPEQRSTWKQTAKRRYEHHYRVEQMADRYMTLYTRSLPVNFAHRNRKSLL